MDVPVLKMTASKRVSEHMSEHMPEHMYLRKSRTHVEAEVLELVPQRRARDNGHSIVASLQPVQRAEPLAVVARRDARVVLEDRPARTLHGHSLVQLWPI